MSDERGRVFISYASADADVATRLANELRQNGIPVWIDKLDLAPGPWKTQIERAIAKARYFIICLSETALARIGDSPGFQDEELQQAYAIARQQPLASFAIVPVRIEPCSRGDHRTAANQQYDLFPDWDAGIEALMRALRATPSPEASGPAPEKPERISGLEGRAHALYFAGDYEGALQAWSEIAAATGVTSETWFRQGLNWEAQGDLEQALRAYESAVKLDATNLAAMNNLGVVLSRMSEYRKSVVCFDEVLAREPSYALAIFNKTLVLLEMGNDAEARAAFREIDRVDPRVVARFERQWGRFSRIIPLLREQAAKSAVPLVARSRIEDTRPWKPELFGLGRRGPRGGGWEPMSS